MAAVAIIMMVLVVSMFVYAPHNAQREPSISSAPISASPSVSPTLVKNLTVSTTIITISSIHLAPNGQMEYTGPVNIGPQRTYDGNISLKYLDQCSMIAPTNTTNDVHPIKDVYANLTVSGVVYSYNSGLSAFSPGTGTTEYYIYLAPNWTVSHPTSQNMYLNVSVVSENGLVFNTLGGSFTTAQISGTGINEITSTSPPGNPNQPVPVMWGFMDEWNVNFIESGLPSGMEWNATLSGNTQSSTTTDISFLKPNGTYSWSIPSIAGYTWYSGSPGTITVAGNTVTIDITWSIKTYSVQFSETGLPTNTQWYVNVSGQSTLTGITASLSENLPNGSYTFMISSANNGYHVETYSNSFTINGAGATLDFTFAATLYQVSFSETGLPAGTQWTVKVNGTAQGSATSSIDFELGNGGYSYLIPNLTFYAPTPSSGTFTVNGANKAFDIVFGTLYQVTFNPQGLPPATNWSVTFNGVQSNATGAHVFYALNGTYGYSVGAVGDYYPSPPSGSASINGQSVSIDVTFTRYITITLIATFPAGTPSGINWSVDAYGHIYHSTTNTIIFTVPAGEVEWQVVGPSGYYASPAAYANYLSSNTTINITFTAQPPNIISEVFGNLEFLLLIFFLGVIIVVALYVKWRFL